MGDPFRPSNNEYDWLGPGIYFWEANPRRGLEFAQDAVKGGFTEGGPIYPGAGFNEKTHIQIVVRNQQCIKGVFRVSGVGPR